jgi:hypothetical protein
LIHTLNRLRKEEIHSLIYLQLRAKHWEGNVMTHLPYMSYLILRASSTAFVTPLAMRSSAIELNGQTDPPPLWSADYPAQHSTFFRRILTQWYPLEEEDNANQ